MHAVREKYDYSCVCVCLLKSQTNVSMFNLSTFRLENAIYSKSVPFERAENLLGWIA